MAAPASSEFADIYNLQRSSFDQSLYDQHCDIATLETYGQLYDQLTECNKVIIYKPIGCTPKQIAEYWRQYYGKSKVGFAGRLDPMAHGNMCLLFDDACADTAESRDYDKRYYFEICTGLSTDTTDILGILQTHNIQQFDRDIIDNTFERYNGLTYQQQYHIYSSYCYRKRPLWWWARENRLHEAIIPTKQVTIEQLQQLDMQYYDNEQLRSYIMNRLDRFYHNNHDQVAQFRYDDIVTSWRHYFDNPVRDHYMIIKCVAHVTSGTYIRQLVKDIAHECNTPMFVLDIYRYNVH